MVRGFQLVSKGCQGDVRDVKGLKVCQRLSSNVKGCQRMSWMSGVSRVSRGVTDVKLCQDVRVSKGFSGIKGGHGCQGMSRC